MELLSLFQLFCDIGFSSESLIVKIFRDALRHKYEILFRPRDVTAVRKERCLIKNC